MTDIADFTGEVVVPGATEWDTVRITHGAHDASPALIVRPRTTADIAAAISYSVAESLPLVIRSGGHTAYSSRDGALVIDLGGFHDVEVLGGGLVRIGSGAQWGEVAAALTPHGLALSSGDAVTVGVGGLTLSGGIGWLVRQVGFTLDNLVEVEVVLASGDVVTASEDASPDLFWAVRGGGGNFGVVTRFTFSAYPLGNVIAGTITFDPEDLRSAMTGWRDVMRGAPEELNATLTAKPAFGPQAPASVVVTVCYGGDDARAAEAAIAPLLALPTVTASDISERTYAQMLTDEHLPVGLKIVDNNGFAREVSDELIDDLVRLKDAAANSVLMIRWLSGALNRVAQDATALAHRDAQALVVTAVAFPPGVEVTDADQIAGRWAALSDYFLGMYGNFTMDARPGAADAIYPPATLAKLRALKKTYDSKNVFSANHNILPA